MIITDQKKAIATMMAKRRPDGSVDSAPMVPSSTKTEEGEIDPRHAAAEDIMTAFHEKHAGKLMEAMAAFHDLHSMRKEPSE